MESVVEDQSQGGATLDARGMRLAASGRMVRQSDRFLKAIAGYDRVAIVAHDNPDPEKLATFGQFIKKFGYRIDTTSPKGISQTLNRLMTDIDYQNSYRFCLLNF